MNEYQDQSVWFEVYALDPEAKNIPERQMFVEDFDTQWEAEAFAEGYFGQHEEYRIKRCTGLDAAMNKCEGQCTDARGARHTYSCYYGTEWIEGPHEEHDWFSAVYDDHMHCYGSD